MAHNNGLCFIFVSSPPFSFDIRTGRIGLVILKIYENPNIAILNEGGKLKWHNITTQLFSGLALVG